MRGKRRERGEQSRERRFIIRSIRRRGGFRGAIDWWHYYVPMFGKKRGECLSVESRWPIDGQSGVATRALNSEDAGRRGWTRIVSGLSVGTAFGSPACRPLFSLCYAATEAPLQRSAVGLYTARVPRQSRPGAVRFDVEMIVVANGQFASRSGRPMADRTCTANANKVDPGCPLSPALPPLQPPRALSALVILPSALWLSSSVGPRYTRPRYTNSHL